DAAADAREAVEHSRHRSQRRRPADRRTADDEPLLRGRMTRADVTSSMQAVAAIYRRDPKRAGLIAAATVAMLGVGVRLLLGGTSRASAATPLLVRTSDHATAQARTETAPARPTVDPAALSAWLNAERHTPRRNLFAADRSSVASSPVTDA